MLGYVVRRLLTAIPMMLIITVLNFAVMRLAPGDPLVFMLIADQTEGMTAYDVRDKLQISQTGGGARLSVEDEGDPFIVKRRQLGLDKPIITQYVNWLSHVLRGDFGRSMRTAS